LELKDDGCPGKSKELLHSYTKTMEDLSLNKEIARALIIMGVLIALGLSAGGFLLGTQVKRIGSGRQSIVVKGLAEKAVKADYGEWITSVRIESPTFPAALKSLREQTPLLSQFLLQQGFDKEAMKLGPEEVSPNMVEEKRPDHSSGQVQKGYLASQDIVITTKDLAKILSASKAILDAEAITPSIRHSQPLFLVSNLEDIKMSLIGAATQNAQKRAEEFAKNGGIKAGVMRSASQGAFYILAAGADIEGGDYGGAYDKTTIDKQARVVVTIEYAIEN
jgi:uncharacterized protein